MAREFDASELFQRKFTFPLPSKYTSMSEIVWTMDEELNILALKEPSICRE